MTSYWARSSPELLASDFRIRTAVPVVVGAVAVFVFIFVFVFVFVGGSSSLSSEPMLVAVGATSSTSFGSIKPEMMSERRSCSRLRTCRTVRAGK